ncbi:MAG: peptidoglycan recognition protein family protein [Proteobacteria bacterium]|nr:peptidoglycan recognition protein family protein [Pseudomonadota bacterium]
MWRDTQRGRYIIPPVGASIGSINGPPLFFGAGVRVISRAAWGARPPITDDPDRSYERYTEPLTDVYDSIVVHHSGNRGYRTMSEIQAEHQDDQDRADVGYHFGIALSGHVYEGRPIDIKGSHVDGANTGKIGIVLMADLDTTDTGVLFDLSDDEITNRMQGSLIRLIEQLKREYPGIRFLGGHKEFDKRRNCPGDLPMDRMDSWRSATGLVPPP